MDELITRLSSPEWYFTSLVTAVVVNLISNQIQIAMERRPFPKEAETIIETTSYIYVLSIFCSVVAAPFFRDVLHVKIFDLWQDVIVFAFLGAAALTFYLRAFSASQLVLLFGLNVAVFVFFCLINNPGTNAGLVYRLALTSIGYSLLLVLLGPLIFRILRWVKGQSGSGTG